MEIIDHRDLVVKKEKLFTKKKRFKKSKPKKEPVCDNPYTPSISGYIVSILLGLFFYGITLTLLLSQNTWRKNYILPSFFPNPLTVIISTSILYLLLMIGLLLVVRQGANKKVYGLYLANSITIILLITSVSILQVFVASLFISLLCVFLSFTLLHELTKLNKFAYFSFIPYAVSSIIVCILIYFVTMLN